MRFVSKVLVLVCWMMASAQSRANSDDSVFGADYALVQTGGFAGVVAAGFGWEASARHEFNAMIGYVPAWLIGFELWQATAKYEYHPFATESRGRSGRGRVKPSPLYIGLGAIYGHHEDLYLDDLPEQYPDDDYYEETALRFTLNAGTAFAIWGWTFFIEYAALDYGIIAYSRDPEWFQEHYRFWGLEGIGSLGFGIKWYFDEG